MASGKYSRRSPLHCLHCAPNVEQQSDAVHFQPWLEYWSYRRVAGVRCSRGLDDCFLDTHLFCDKMVKSSHVITTLFLYSNTCKTVSASIWQNIESKHFQGHNWKINVNCIMTWLNKIIFSTIFVKIRPEKARNK